MCVGTNEVERCGSAPPFTGHTASGGSNSDAAGSLYNGRVAETAKDSESAPALFMTTRPWWRCDKPWVNVDNCRAAEAAMDRPYRYNVDF